MNERSNEKRSVWQTDVPGPQVAIAFAMVLALIGPGISLVAFPDNEIVDSLFGGPQMFVFWIVSIYGLHQIETHWLKKAHGITSDKPD